MIRLAAPPLLLALLLALPACGSAEAEVAQDLADCRAQLEQYVADRQDYLREAMPELSAEADGTEPSAEQLEQFAALQGQIDAYDNMIRVQELRCNGLARGQE